MEKIEKLVNDFKALTNDEKFAFIKAHGTRCRGKHVLSSFCVVLGI